MTIHDFPLAVSLSNGMDLSLPTRHGQPLRPGYPPPARVLFDYRVLTPPQASAYAASATDACVVDKRGQRFTFACPDALSPTAHLMLLCGILDFDQIKKF
jgi:hypothetical protein